MSQPAAVVIVGDSIAGVTAARELRTLGHGGRITLIGADPHGAYSRPPLSKTVLEDDSPGQTSCVGEMPNTPWLQGTGLADHIGIGIDHACATAFRMSTQARRGAARSTVSTL